MIQNAFHADSVRVIFLPYWKSPDEQRKLTGIFMEGEASQRDLFKIDLKNTLID